MKFQIGISRRAYAKRRGVSDKAVRNALQVRIRDALLPDGTIDADLADQLWEGNTDPTQRRGKQAERAEASLREAEAKASAAPPAKSPDPDPDDEDEADEDEARQPLPRPRAETFEEDPPRRRPALSLDDHVARNRAGRAPAQDDGDDAPVLLDLAVQERAEKVRKLRLANDEKEGKLIPAAPHRAHTFAAIRSITESWQNWPDKAGPDLAAQLGTDSFKTTQALKDLVREHLLTLSSRKEKEQQVDA